MGYPYMYILMNIKSTSFKVHSFQVSHFYGNNATVVSHYHIHRYRKVSTPVISKLTN